MNGTTYEYGDFNLTLLELMDPQGEFAWMLGSDTYARLVKLVWALSQAVNDQEVSSNFSQLYQNGLDIWQSNGLRVLRWICAENKSLNGVSPLEALFDEKSADEPLNILGRLKQGVCF